MRFQKGHPKPANSGRKKGVRNKSKIARVQDVLDENKLNPVQALLDLLPHLEPKDQARVWSDLLTYCEAKPKTFEVEDNHDDEDGDEISLKDHLAIVKNIGKT